ncbi:Efflux pump FUS6 [Colletotrichum spinosum]|uniref:Efflux pump FUS6 n=1 Tax=Colletotrichum spinosum TaxID=1347390 RepID=A0A4R8PR29_9PEZI|nr:Efflux pump FUS6 [Colletotrichum spinosum]
MARAEMDQFSDRVDFNTDRNTDGSATAKSNPDSPVALKTSGSSEGIAGTPPDEDTPKAAGRGWAFWAIFASLSVTALLSSMEGGIMSTALPAISRAVDAERDYIWIVNVYFLTSAAVQPLYGQVADIWGRRWPMLASVVIFAAGSAVCGAANDAATLIGGRAVQGLGAAGINTLVEIILCDLLPLRERGQFMGLLFLFIVVGSVLGPFLGGLIVERTSWRWVFYLNLPICGVCLVLLFFSLKLKHRGGDDDDAATPLEKLGRIDYAGLLLLCASVTSLLYGLTYGGGSRYAWSHPVVVATLVLGVVGHGLFVGFEASPWCPHPALPIALFQNRTSVAAYVAEVVQILVSYGALYFLPLYFQSTLLVYPERSGILLLPFSVLFCFSAAVGGGVVTKMGRFRTVHVGSFALMTVMMGVFTLLDRRTSPAVVAVLGVVAGVSVGLPNASILTAVQAALPDSLNAASTGAFAFIRSISTVFSVTVPAAVFNSRFDGLLAASGLDPGVRAGLDRGQAYQQASRDFVRSFPPEVQDQVVAMYEMSLRRVWQVLIALAGVGVVAALVEKDLECRAEQTTDEFGLKEGAQAAEKSEA